MIFIFFILAIGTCSESYKPPMDPIHAEFCKCENLKANGRILNGFEANELDLQYAAVVYTKNGADYRPFCSGVIINKSFVLTAAQCKEALMYNQAKSQISYVGVGSKQNTSDIFSSPANYRVIKFFHVHPYYQFLPKTNETIHDIGLIETDKPFEFGENTKILPACMFLYDFEKIKNYKDKEIIIAGYGQQTSNDKNGFKKINLNTTESRPHVVAKIDSLTYAHTKQTSQFCPDKSYPNTICLMNANIAVCPSDLGGPVLSYSQTSQKLFLIAIHHNVLAGNKTKNQCEIGRVSSATLIYPYLDWINLFVNNEICRKSKKLTSPLPYNKRGFRIMESVDVKATILSMICLFSVVALLTFYTAMIFHDKVRKEMQYNNVRPSQPITTDLSTDQITTHLSSQITTDLSSQITTDLSSQITTDLSTNQTIVNDLANESNLQNDFQKEQCSEVLTDSLINDK